LRTGRFGLRAFCGCRGKQRPDLPARDDLVDGPVLHGSLGGQDEVAVGVLGHALNGLAGVPGDEPVHQIPVANELLGLDLDVDGLASAAPREAGAGGSTPAGARSACPSRRPTKARLGISAVARELDLTAQAVAARVKYIEEHSGR
jgi:hypothetical protein